VPFDHEIVPMVYFSLVFGGNFISVVIVQDNKLDFAFLQQIEVFLGQFKILCNNNSTFRMFSNILTRFNGICGINSSWKTTGKYTTKKCYVPLGSVESNYVQGCEFLYSQSNQGTTKDFALVCILLICQSFLCLMKKLPIFYCVLLKVPEC
jgi:hypothetical protein